MTENIVAMNMTLTKPVRARFDNTTTETVRDLIGLSQPQRQ